MCGYLSLTNFGYCNDWESLEVNLLKINKYFTVKILLILEVTFPSELSEKRIYKPQNHVFFTLIISYWFFSIFGSVKMWKQEFVSDSSQENT